MYHRTLCFNISHVIYTSFIEFKLNISFAQNITCSYWDLVIIYYYNYLMTAPVIYHNIYITVNEVFYFQYIYRTLI